MKRFVLSAIVAAAALASVSSQAATDTGTSFNVDISLTPVCQVRNLTGAITLAYTSFQAGPVSDSVAFDVRCTTSMAYTLGITGGSGTTIADSVTNLNYTVTLSSVSGTGNGADQNVTATAAIAGGQSGTCGTVGGGACDNTGATNKTKVVTLTY
jgi:spore coat protein U-like protein